MTSDTQSDWLIEQSPKRSTLKGICDGVGFEIPIKIVGSEAGFMNVIFDI